jgi:hypothetical protein
MRIGLPRASIRHGIIGISPDGGKASESNGRNQSIGPGGGRDPFVSF